MAIRATCILYSVDSRQRKVINPLYLALVRTHLKSCIQFDPLMGILKQVQQRAIKMIRGLQHMTYEEFEKVELVGFKEERLKGMLLSFSCLVRKQRRQRQIFLLVTSCNTKNSELWVRDFSQ